jgi:transposase
MPWKTMDVHEQRVRFVVAASLATKSFRQLCDEFGVSRPTGYEWEARYRAAGLDGIAERSRRPLRSPRQTVPELAQRVIELRRRSPDWGARKLQVLLEREGIRLGYSTIHRILLQHDLVRDQDRREVGHPRVTPKGPRVGKESQLWATNGCGPPGRSILTGLVCSICNDCFPLRPQTVILIECSSL